MAAKILAAHGGLAPIRAAVLELLPPTEAAAAARHWRSAAAAAAVLRRRGPGGLSGAGPGLAGEAGGGEAGEEELLRATPAADSGLDEAARLAGPGLVGSHHLVLAALTDPGTAAAQALVAAGIDLERAREAMRAADVTGSTDELPQDAGRRQMLIRVTGDRVTIEMSDPAMIRLAQAALHALSGPGGSTGKAAEAGEAETGRTGEIRGDQPTSASLSDVWLALRDSLENIAIQGAAAGAGEAGSGAGSGREGPPAGGRDGRRVAVPPNG